MLDYHKNRLDYGMLLIPPSGYRLNQAIAATYSVDLNTLLSIPVALFYSQTLEGNIVGDRFQLLEAVRNTIDKVTVYHQKGKIHFPSSYNRLYSFLEDVLVPVTPDSAFHSFHPKIWVLRYESDEDNMDVIYRNIVLSRNLTYDRSWDVATCLEGAVSKEPIETNNPLIDFLKYLNGKQPFREADNFLNDLSTVQFKLPNGFRKYSYFPMGIPGYENVFFPYIKKQKATNMLCISPFLKNDALKELEKYASDKRWLLSRSDELKYVKRDTLSHFECYNIMDLAVDGERFEKADETQDDIMEQDLHAKMFVFEKNTCNWWFIGSANATKAAFGKNTEFLVCLYGTSQSVFLKNLIKILLGDEGKNTIFERYPFEHNDTDPKENDQREDMLRQLEFELLKLEIEAFLERSSDSNNYDEHLSIDLGGIDFEKGVEVSVKPLSSSDSSTRLKGNVFQKLTYKNISESEISCFLVFQINYESQSYRKFIVKHNLTGIPETRYDTVFKSIVDSQDKFFEYLRFLLLEDIDKDTILQETTPKSAQSFDNVPWNIDLPIFEQILLSASRSPKKLKSIDDLITRLSSESDFKDIVPLEFIGFWNVFKSYLNFDTKG